MPEYIGLENMMPSKDQHETVDYVFDFGRLAPADDVIVTAQWTLPLPLVNAEQHEDGLRAQIFISGGERGAVYDVDCVAVTAQNRRLNLTGKLPIIERTR